MNANVGTVDRVIRIVLALIIGGAGWAMESWWGLLAIIPLLTAFVRFCPLYTVFGFSTCPIDPAKQ